MERALRAKYVATIDDVYRLATNSLAGLDIDVQKIEAVNPPAWTLKSKRG
jgi:hypothetical protein